jgi:cellulose synthase/poly-beta-1,6-N-acetylglucosamine synthase-like glycosyltransferase
MNLAAPVGAVLAGLDWAILLYFLAANGFYLLLLISAGWEMRSYVLTSRADSRWRLVQSRTAPTVSLLAPAHNEAATISDSVQAMLGLYYPNLEVVIINDGSTDTTLDVLIGRFRLVPAPLVFRQVLATEPVVGLHRSRSHPNLLVVDKRNGGKADSLNAGMNVASGQLACAVDADTLIEPDAIQRMVWPFLTTANLIAAGGTIRVANQCQIRGGRVIVTHVPRRGLSGFQVVEYLRAFLFGRLGWNRMGGNLIISGAFGLFDRAAVLAAGGYAANTVGEDMELVVRLRRKSYEAGRPGLVAFVPDPVAWTEVPETARVLSRQRDRWQRGLADVLWRNRKLLFNPWYGSLGLVAYPYFFFVELFGPVVEAIGLLGLVASLALGAVDVPFAAVYFLVAYGLGICMGAFTLVLEEFSFHRYETVPDRLVLFGWAVAENLGYRQLTVVWRLHGLIKFLRGRTDWGAMQRRGFTEDPSAPAPASRSEPG